MPHSGQNLNSESLDGVVNNASLQVLGNLSCYCHADEQVFKLKGNVFYLLILLCWYFRHLSST